MTRILVVDDHPLVRKGVVQTLVDEFPDGAVEEASNDIEALQAVWNRPLDLIVLDISFPGRSGLELLKEIRDARPRLPVLVLSMHSEAQFATRTLKAGAAGYVTKDSPPGTLVQAARRALAGGKFITPSTAERLASELRSDPSKEPHEQLSDREYDVMLRIAGGTSASQIAQRLNLSIKTVSTYRTRLLQKMGMTSNAEITQYALRSKLID